MGAAKQKSALAQGLGAFSLALGAPALTTPGRFVEAIGLEDTPRARAIARGVGVQELLVGAGILARPRPYGLLWSRVAGDLLHLGLLGASYARGPKDKARLGAAIGNVAAIMVVDAVAARTHDPSPPSAAKQGRTGEDKGETVRVPSGPERVHATVTMRGSRDEVRQLFLEGDELPDALHSLQVEEAGDDRFFWRAASGATGQTWFKNAPAGRGVEIHVEAEIPAGWLGKLGGKTVSAQLMESLRRIKQVVETGEVVRSEGNPDGPSLKRFAKQRRAQPVTAATPSSSQSSSSSSGEEV